MAKSSKERDRRAVVEQLRRDQKRSERRRTIAVILACVVVGLVIVGLAAVPLIRQNSEAKKPLADLGFEIVASTPAAFAETIKADVKRFGDIARAANISVE